MCSLVGSPRASDDVGWEVDDKKMRHLQRVQLGLSPVMRDFNAIFARSGFLDQRGTSLLLYIRFFILSPFFTIVNGI